MIHRRFKPVAVIALLPLLSLGCSIDTEPGLAVEVSAATVTVTGMDTTQVVALSLDSSFRVGEHAPDSWTFRPTGADVFVGETPAVSLSPDRPPTFDGELAPGEREEVQLSGQSDMGLFTEARALLCAPGATATVLLRWEARKVGAEMSPIADDFGNAEATSTSISCE